MSAADELIELLSGSGDVPLDRALLLLAASRPDGPTTIEDGLERLDRLATTCPAASVEAITRHLFTTSELRGDPDDFHDARNSFLDQVLHRRMGMPIMLCAVMLVTGRRLGVPLEGIGMPGHFLVADPLEPDWYVDPHAGGSRITTGQCEARFRAVNGTDVPFDPSYLAPVGNRSIVVRVLNNLTVTFRSRSLQDLDWLLDMRIRIPAEPPELRALADLCELRGRYLDAASLLDRLEERTGGEVAARKAHQLRARLN